MKTRKLILWIAGGTVIVAVVLVATAFLLLQFSHGTRAYLLRRVEQNLGYSTGAHIAIRDFKLTLSALQVGVYGITAHGKEAATQRPLFTADHLGFSVVIDSVVGRKWHLRTLTADHPVVSVSMNKSGNSNLPQPRQPSSGNTDIFELAIGQTTIHQGELYYNDQKTPIDAELGGLEFAAAFDSSRNRYHGDLHYRNGNIRYEAYAPVTHSLDAKFEVTPETFRLNQVVLTAGSSRLTLDASIEEYAKTPQLRANYEVVLATEDVADMLQDSTIPAGDIHVIGTLSNRSQADRPFLESVNITGTIRSKELRIVTRGVRAAVRDLGASYTLNHGNASIDGLHAKVLGGSLDARLSVRDLAGRQFGKLQASLRGVSLEQLQIVSHSRPPGHARLAGSINADAQATWTQSLHNMIAHANAALHGTFGQNPATPVDGIVDADYRAAAQQVEVHHSYLRTPKTAITLDGSVSRSSQLQVHMTSSDLHEIELLAADVRGPANGLSEDRLSEGRLSEDLGLYGKARLNASVAGSLDDPQVRGSLEATNLRLKGSSWRVLSTDFQANPSSFVLTNGKLQAATQGHFSFNVQTGLTRWAYAPASPISVSLSASQLSIADLERLAGKNLPVTGTLAMNVSMHGSQRNLIGQGNINIVNAVVSSEPIRNINLTFHGQGNTVYANLNAYLPAGSAEANTTIDLKSRAYELQVHVADLRLEKLQTMKSREIIGGLNLDASGRGTMESPQLEATLAIPELHVRQQTIRDVALKTSVRNNVANLVFDSQALGTFVKARGTLGLKAPYACDVRLDTGRIEFQRPIATSSPGVPRPPGVGGLGWSPVQAENLSGETELHATLRGPLQNKAQMEGHLEIPTVTAAYRQFKIASAKPVRVDYKNGTATLQPAALEGTGTNLSMQASVPINNPNAATLTLKGTIDLHIAQLLLPDWESKGQIRIDIDSHGVGSAAEMSGQVHIVDATVHPPDIPLGLDHANGVINVTPNRLDVGSFQGQMSGGTITAKGGMSFRPSVQFNLGLDGHNVRLRYPEGIRALLESTFALTGTPQASRITGQVKIQHISFTPDFDLASFAGQFEGETSPPATTGGFLQDMRLNVAVQSASQMNLQSSQVSLSGNANLRVVGTVVEPVVLGHTTLTGGELFFSGNRYVLQSGTVDFLNPVRTEPILNLHVQTKINEYAINVRLQGPVTSLRTSYTSDPALPPADIINLIARGQTTEAAAAQPSQPLSLGAQSLVASTVSGQIGSKIAKAAGISQLQIDPSLGVNNGQNPGARIAIQQHVTSNLFVTFATDVTSTQRQALELEYHFNPRWSVTGVRDQNGGITAQGHFKKRF